MPEFLHPASLFESRESLARDGETPSTMPLTKAATASKRREEDADAALRRAGFDACGNPLDAAPSEDIMTRGKRAMMARQETAPESDWLTVAALTSGEQATRSADIEAEIDSAKAYTVAFAKHCTGFAKPCSQTQLLTRIDAGLLLIPEARSQYHLDFLTFTIKSDCETLGIKSLAELAVAVGCSTSSVYTKINSGGFEFALAVIAGERHMTIREARQHRWRKIDIERAIRGSRFDVGEMREAVKVAPLSLKLSVAFAIVKEATSYTLVEASTLDKGVHMIPRSRLRKLAELGLLSLNTLETLSRLSPQERDDWLAEQEAEQLRALFGGKAQRQAARHRYDLPEYSRRIREAVGAGDRFAPTRPNVPPSLAEIAKRKSSSKKKAA
jgi:hypothetical protein